MSNDVVVHVKAENHTQSDLDGARRGFADFARDTVKRGISAGTEAGQSFSKSLSGAVSSASGSLGPILAGAGVVAAPLIGASIAGAIVGGVGVGGVVGGFLAAKDDPRVAGALKGMQAELQSEFKSAGQTFVQPTLEGISTINKAIDTIDLQGIFADSSKFVKPLTDGIGSAIEDIGNGVEDIMGKAGPAVEAFGNSFAEIGDAVGDTFSLLSNDADEGASAIDDLTNATVNFIKTAGGIVHGLAEFKGGLDSLDNGIDSFRYKLEDIASIDAFGDGAQFDITADGYARNTEAAELYRQGLIGAKGEVDDYNAYTKAQAEKQTELQEAVGGSTLAMTNFSEENAKASATTEGVTRAIDELNNSLLAEVDPVFNLLDAQKGLADAQKDVTKAIDKFGKKSPEAQEALRDLATKALKLDVAGKELGGTFDGKMTPAMRRTLSAAGLTKGQISSLEGQFRSARRTGDNFARTYAAKLRVDGYPAVYSRLYSVKDVINDIPRSVNIAMRITGVSSASAAAAAIRKNMATGGIKGAANGATSSGLTWTGEHGPELVDLPPGSKVHSNGDSMRMVGQGGLSGPVTINLVLADGSVLGKAVLPSLREMNRARFGNSAERMLAG